MRIGVLDPLGAELTARAGALPRPAARIGAVLNRMPRQKPLAARSRVEVAAIHAHRHKGAVRLALYADEERPLGITLKIVQTLTFSLMYSAIKLAGPVPVGK